MAVTVDASSIVGGGSGLTGWSAKSTFSYPRIIKAQTTTDLNNTTIGGSAANTMIAQSFTPGANLSISEVWLNSFKLGSPSDNITLEIRPDATSKPHASTVLATSDAVAATSITSGTWVKFTFSSPASLTSATKYWIVEKRSGSVDGSNYIGPYIHVSNPYASHGHSQFDGSSWSTEDASVDHSFIAFASVPDLFQVTQDTKLHVWKSTDNGSSWSELDAGNGPTVNSSTKPFSADLAIQGKLITGGGLEIVCAYFSGTNTVRARYFDVTTGLWATTDLQSADASTDADFNRNIRVIANSSHQVVFYTSLADDADLEYVRRTTGAWGSQTQTLVINSTESSCYSDVIKDGGGFAQMFWHDAADDDYELRSLTGTTLGTELDIDATAADVETEHASANYAVYDVGGTDTVIAAYIDADGSIQERVLSLEVTSASVSQGTEHAVGTATTTLGRSLATCKYGSDLFVFAGLAAGIDYYADVGATGTWSSVTNWITGLTNAVLSTAVPIAGVGILVSYTDNGNVVTELLVPTFAATGNATVGTAPAAGGTHTATGVAHQTGTTTIGTAAAAGGTHSATAGAIGTATVGTSSAAGGSHTGSFVAHQTGTSTVGTAPAAGGTHTGAAQRHETGTHTSSDAAATGHAATGSAGTQDSGTATVGTAPAAGGTHTGSYVAHEEGTSTVGTCAAAGGTHTGTAGLEATGTATVGEATATGGAHTGSFVANLTGTATVGTAAAAGGDHSAFAAGADEGAHIRGTATADGGTHTGIVTASATTVTGTASAAGGTHSGAYGATGTHTAGSAVATGGTHTGSFGTTSTAVVGTATATGGDHTGTSGTTGALVVGTATAIGGEHLGADGSAVDATGNAIVGTATATGGTAFGEWYVPYIIIKPGRTYTVNKPVDTLSVAKSGGTLIVEKVPT
jgi:hypothetical protein